MIKSFNHKGLKAFFEKGTKKGINPNHADKLSVRLAILDAAETLDQIDQPGFRLHELSGDLDGQHAIDVSGNVRLFFKFEDGNVYLLDYGDYH
jgi:proteic killer suppression protein